MGLQPYDNLDPPDPPDPGEGVACETVFIPCARCNELITEEFVIPDDIWNAVIRVDGRERGDEYICLDCWHAALRLHVLKPTEKETIAPSPGEGEGPWQTGGFPCPGCDPKYEGDICCECGDLHKIPYDAEGRYAMGFDCGVAYVTNGEETEIRTLAEAMYELNRLAGEAKKWEERCQKAMADCLDVGMANMKLSQELDAANERVRELEEACRQARGSMQIDAMVDDDGKFYGTTQVALAHLDKALNKRGGAAC